MESGRPRSGPAGRVDAVIHLAGASIAGRFTEEHRAAIRDSRIGPTRRLAELIAQSADGPKVLISASAIGYYGYDRGDQTLTEDSERGDGFLADVVADWEDATAPAEQAGTRVVRVRTGIVQSPAGGTLRLLRPLFAAGLGGRARQRPAVAVLDRDRRPGRRLPPCAVGHRLVRAGQRGGRRTGPQRRLHPNAGPRAAPAGAAAGAAARTAAAARRAGRARTRLRQPTGAARAAATGRPSVSPSRPRADAAASARHAGR